MQRILSAFRGKEKALRYYLAGFIDGEGSFSVSIVRHPTQKSGWMINPCFQVYQHETHREILEVCRHVFNTGSIYRKSGTHPVLNFSIDSRRNILEKVIPFFDRYPLIVKHETYRKFRSIVVAMGQQEHFTQEGFRRIVETAFSMNQQGKGRKYSREEILASARHLPTHISHESSETTRRIRRVNRRRAE